VVTNKPRVATQCALLHGAVPVVVRADLDTSSNKIIESVGARASSLI
jgi:hypothetical protein